ncbi:MAG: flagellar hook-length control protein FliK [Thermodesulfobacteriota bacterium]
MKITGFPSLKEIRLATDSGRRAEAAVSRALPFAAGELVQGKVTGLTPEGKVLLAIGGITIEARSEVALKVGGEFWFEVRQTGAEPWLALAGKKGAAQEVLRLLAAGGPALGRLLPGLAALAQGEGLAPELRAQVETLLQSLGAMAHGAEPAPEKVLTLLAALRGEQGIFSVTTPLAEQLAALLEELPLPQGETATRSQGLLAAMAHCNQQVPAQHQPLFWLFPCFFAMGEGAGSWLLQTTAEEGAAGGTAYTLSFFLEMSRLGEVQLQVTVQENEVRGVFFLADETAVAHLRREVPELKERLAALGYRAGSFSCQVARGNLVQGLKIALEEAAGLAPTRLLDVKA